MEAPAAEAVIARSDDLSLQLSHGLSMIFSAVIHFLGSLAAPESAAPRIYISVAYE